MHRWCLLNLTVPGFSLNLTVRGVSHKHCLLTFFIFKQNFFLNQCSLGAQWLSGRVLDSRPKGHGFELTGFTALCP